MKNTLDSNPHACLNKIIGQIIYKLGLKIRLDIKGPDAEIPMCLLQRADMATFLSKEEMVETLSAFQMLQSI